MSSLRGQTSVDHNRDHLNVHSYFTRQLWTFKGTNSIEFWFKKTDGWNEIASDTGWWGEVTWQWLTWDHSPSTQTPTHSALLHTWLTTGLTVSSQRSSSTILLLSRIQWTARLCSPDNQQNKSSTQTRLLQWNVTFPPGDTVPRGTRRPGTLDPGVASLQTAGPPRLRLPNLGWLTDGCWQVLSHVGLWELDDTFDRPELETSTAALGAERPGSSLPDQGRIAVTRVGWTNRNIKHRDFIRNWRDHYHSQSSHELVSILLCGWDWDGFLRLFLFRFFFRRFFFFSDFERNWSVI